MTFPTLVEVTNRLDPGGAIANISNVLTRLNPMLEDIPWVEGNLPTGHRMTLATALPSPTWRRYNEGVAGTVAKTNTFDEACGMMEAWSRLDVDLANLNGNSAAFRASEDKLFAEGLAQELGTALFYYSTSGAAQTAPAITPTPNVIHGLAPRYTTAWNNTTLGNTAHTGGYVLYGTNTATGCWPIWLINWGEDRVFGIYPKGSKGGLQTEDLGRLPALDSSSNYFLAYQTRWNWQCGLAVRDYRYVVRAQIDTDDTAGAFGSMATTGKGVINIMEQMLTNMYNCDIGQPVFYMPRTVFALFLAQCSNNNLNVLDYVQKAGSRLRAFQGFPIRITDSLVTEDALS
jgi:hypothetical protein